MKRQGHSRIWGGVRFPFLKLFDIIKQLGGKVSGKDDFVSLFSLSFIVLSTCFRYTVFS